jgi:hypothetical protein
MNAYRLQRSGLDCIVDLVDDDPDVRDDAHRFLGGALDEFALRATSADTETVRREYADCISSAVSTEKHGTYLNRYLVTDNYVPIPDVGKELALRGKDFWVIVITYSREFDDSDIDNPRYLGWLKKERLPQLCEALNDVIDGKAGHDWLRERLLEMRGRGRAESIRSIKHNIVNLLTPTRLDLESVYEAWVFSGEAAAAGMLKDVTAAHRGKPGHYQALLRRVREMAAGGRLYSAEQGEDSDVTWDSTEARGVASGYACLFDVAYDDDFEQSADWRRLCELLGIRKSGRGYAGVADSLVSRLFRQMDEVAGCGEALQEASGVLLNILSDSGWGDDGREGDNPFSEWCGNVCQSLSAICARFEREHGESQGRRNNGSQLSTIL